MDQHEEMFKENVSEASEEFCVEENRLLHYDESIKPETNNEEVAQYVEVKQRGSEDESYEPKIRRLR